LRISATGGYRGLGCQTPRTGLIGKVILAVFGDRVDTRYIYALFIGTFGVGLVVIVNAHALWQVFLFATCIGIGFCGGIVCLMAVLSNYFGTRAFASLAGVAIAINTTLSAIAPKVAGRLFDQGIGRCGDFFSHSRHGARQRRRLIFMRRPGDDVNSTVAQVVAGAARG
jgi:MFS family permease